jgi:hypothetical protein
MKKKGAPGTRLIANPGLDNTIIKRRSSPTKDRFLHAQASHKAAKTLAASFQPDANPLGDFGACPVVFMYRQALELHLKAVVLGDGGNFLATMPDPISVHKTHAVSWLAQFVCQIVTSVKWEEEFRCEGMANLADFKVAIEELNAVDPGSYVFRFPVKAESKDSASGRGNLTIREFARRMDALLELLDSTADALAAEWDLRSDGTGIEDGWSDGDFEPTIQ